MRRRFLTSYRCMSFWLERHVPTCDAEHEEQMVKCLFYRMRLMFLTKLECLSGCCWLSDCLATDQLIREIVFDMIQFHNHRACFLL